MACNTESSKFQFRFEFALQSASTNHKIVQFSHLYCYLLMKWLLISFEKLFVMNADIVLPQGSYLGNLSRFCL